MVYTGIQADTRYAGTLLCYRQFWYFITCYGTFVQTEYVCAGVPSARFWYSSRLCHLYVTQKERKQHMCPKVLYICYAAYFLRFFSMVFFTGFHVLLFTMFPHVCFYIQILRFTFFKKCALETIFFLCQRLEKAFLQIYVLCGQQKNFLPRFFILFIKAFEGAQVL
uniref:PI7L n=1 Tax=African swine fever virus TaxID=10497 RepID=A0A6G7KTF1_ASF